MSPSANFIRVSPGTTTVLTSAEQVKQARALFDQGLLRLRYVYPETFRWLQLLNMSPDKQDQAVLLKNESKELSIGSAQLFKTLLGSTSPRRECKACSRLGGNSAEHARRLHRSATDYCAK